VFVVLQRQTDYVSAQARELQAQADLNAAAAALRRATGTALEARPSLSARGAEALPLRS
jgi:outer membrane protein TolC